MADPEMAAETKSEKPDVKSYSEVVKGKTKFFPELPLPVKPGILTSGKETRQTTEHKMVKRRTLLRRGVRERIMSQILTSGKKTHQTTEHEQPEVRRRSDWLHPSDDYEIEKLSSDVSICYESRWHMYPPLNVPVLWNEDVYMINSVTEEDEQYKLLKYSTSKDSWSNYVIPCTIIERHIFMDEEHSHALTTYDSKLLLVTGAGSEFMSPIKVWEFDATKSTFKPSPDIILPLSRTIFEQCHVAAASEGKYLIIGGRSRFGDIMQCYLYNGTTWVVCDGPRLNMDSNIQLIIINGSVILIERLQMGHDVPRRNLSLIYETSLWSIVDNDPHPWQLLKSTMQYSSQQETISSFFTLETRLSLVSYDYHRRRLTVWHYFMNSESWQKAGSAGVSLSPFWGILCSVRLPDESLMMIFCGVYNTMVYKLKSKLLPRTGLSKKRLRVSRSLPLIKQEKTEKEVGTEKLTHSLPCLCVTSSAVSTSDMPSLKSQQQSESKQIQQYKSGVNMGLPGVDVCGITAVVITNSSLEWQWEGYGLKIHVGENILPADIEQCHINITASLTGQYKFPEDEHLVSAILWFRCEPPCKFNKPVIIELQHCALSHNTSQLGFVKAVCTQKQLPYTFKPVKGGSFSSHSSFGMLELNSFSGTGITQKQTNERKYLANILYNEEKFRVCFNLYFVVTWNTITHRTVIKNRFKEANLYTEQFITFTDQLAFKIAPSPTENWKIKSINSHVVKKKDIDEFAPEQDSLIPYSQFMAKYCGDAESVQNIPALECEVDLVGTKEPCKVTIDISPSLQGIQSSTVTIEEEGKPKIKQLLRELRCKAADWEDIGIQLDIDDGELQLIRSNNTGDNGRCLREMLRRWLTQASPAPSWVPIVEAVEYLGDQEVARNLRIKYLV